MDIEKILDAFRKKLEIADDRVCFICNLRNGNWLPNLQDCLEDANVSTEEFCAACPNWFVVERGRLRLAYGPQCVDGEHLRRILEKVQERRASR